MKETIGNCEICGLVDHHLVGGECPSCRERMPAAEFRGGARRTLAALSTRINGRQDKRLLVRRDGAGNQVVVQILNMGGVARAHSG